MLGPWAGSSATLSSKTYFCFLLLERCQTHLALHPNNPLAPGRVRAPALPLGFSSKPVTPALQVPALPGTVHVYVCKGDEKFHINRRLPNGGLEMCLDFRDANGREFQRHALRSRSDWCFQKLLQLKQDLLPHFRVEDVIYWSQLKIPSFMLSTVLASILSRRITSPPYEF